MKTATKKKIGIGALITGMVTVIALATRKVVAVNGQTLWGYVTYETGDPVVGAEVILGGVPEVGYMSAWSRLGGRYDITNIPPGVYPVSISPGEGMLPLYLGDFSVVPGDANSDGVIDTGDIIKVRRIILGLDPWVPSADANQDGVMNMSDVTKIERIIFGLDPPLASMMFNIEV